MSADPTEGERRPYRSTRRRQQAAETRLLVTQAATTLFAERGWSATGMRDVATAAGVSVETVYSNFGSKRDLLLAAIDAGVVGDTESVPLSDRPEFAELGVGSREERIRAAARLLLGINQRTWGLRQALFVGAVSDPELEAKLHELEMRRRVNIRTGAELVVGGSVDEDVLDALWVVMDADTFATLTQVGGRSDEEYAQWLAATIRRLVATS